MKASDVKVGDKVHPNGKVTKVEDRPHGWRRLWFGESSLTAQADSHLPVASADDEGGGYGNDFWLYLL